MSHIFTGIGVAVTTPMNDGEVNYEAFRRHLEFLKERGVQNFTISGTTGEGTTLTGDEKEELFKIALEVSDGEISVIAGTGSNNTLETIENSKRAEALGVDGLLVITPYYNKTSQAGLIEHFTAIADAVDTPLVLYDVPSRTGMTIEPETIATLAKMDNIAGVKDATGDLAKLTKVRRLVDQETFAFYSGNDDTALPFFALGGDGLISVAGNVIPDHYVSMWDNRFDDPEKSLEVNDTIAPFVEALKISVNPIPIKLLTSSLGFGDYHLRLPLAPLAEVDQIPLVEEFRKLNGDN